jgi:hypothetical protein
MVVKMGGKINLGIPSRKCQLVTFFVALITFFTKPDLFGQCLAAAQTFMLPIFPVIRSTCGKGQAFSKS